MSTDMRTADAAVLKHLGTYHASVSWSLRHGATVEQLAYIVEERCSTYAARAIGRDNLWVCDRDEWWPRLVGLCRDMLDDVTTV